MKPVEKRFRVTLERMDSPLQWVIIRIPFDVGKAWGANGRVKVQVEMDGHVFRTSLLPNRKIGHIMIVNKAMQSATKIRPGSVAQFRLALDVEPRIATVPAELKSILAEYPPLQRWFKQLNYSTRKNISDWIGAVQSSQARVRRAEQIAERLLATMEAERELPPILEITFSRNARAREGWNLMSGAHRRAQLLAVFYYRTPDARARRIAKLVAEAERLAEKRSKPD
jgi:hypothetical protein